MPVPISRSLLHRFLPVALAGTAAVISSFWIAICAAAPEFLWQGLRIALDHPSWADLLSVLLIGLILTFFVEPLMEHARNSLRRVRQRDFDDKKPRHVVFNAGLSFAFALTSVCLHNALTAFVAGHFHENTADNSGLAAGIALTTAWAIVPFAIALAWQSIRYGWLAIPFGVIGGASSCFAGWLFSWSVEAVITTTIPSVLILSLGYRQVMKEPNHRAFVRCAYSVACIAAMWLTTALIVDTILEVYHLESFKLYTTAGFLIDIRFYLGWISGLMLAPSPYFRTTSPLPG
jgi:hypothetical protein